MRQGKGILIVMPVSLAMVVLVPGAQAQPIVVASWHMDETSGTTMVDAVAGDNGTLVNAVGLGAPGYTGTAYSFDGATAYVTAPSTPALNPGTAPMSFTVHLRLTAAPPSGSTLDYDILRKGVASTTGGMYKLEIAHDGRPRCRFVGSLGDVRVHAGFDLADDAWHTITCIRSGTKVSLQIDGGALHTKTGATGTISNTSGIVIGAKPGSDYYKGLLDEISISVG